MTPVARASAGVLFVAFVVLHWLGSALWWWMVGSSDVGAVVFLPAGLTLLAALALPTRRWAGIAGAVVLSDVLAAATFDTDADTRVAVARTVANVAGPLVAALAITAFVGDRRSGDLRLDLGDLRHLSILGLGGVAIGPAISAAIGGAAAAWRDGEDVPDVVLQWWLAHALGVVVVVPLWFCWSSSRSERSWTGPTGLGVVAALVGATVVLLVTNDLPLLFLPLVGLVVLGAAVDVRTVSLASAGVVVATGVVAATDPDGLIGGLTPTAALWVTKVELLFFLTVAYLVAAEVRARTTAARRSFRQTATVAELQRLLLPPTSFGGPGFRAVAVYEAAEREMGVGGDWYLVRRLADGRIVVGVGDIVGHDIEAARTMAAVRSGLVLEAALDPTPHRLLERLDAFAEIEPSIRFGCAWIGTFDPSTRTLSYACAGHLPPLLATEGPIVPLDEANTALIGVAQGRRWSASVRLPQDACLVLYTDGLVERRHESIDAGVVRLGTALEGRRQDPRSVVDDLLADSPGDDDAILVLIEFTEAGADEHAANRATTVGR